jgi:hypothetical protein
MITAGRNQRGLEPEQIERCRGAWDFLCGQQPVELDIADAARAGSRTRFSESRAVVVLGADALPGVGADACSRLSVLACLAHELAHLERWRAGYRRPAELPDVLLDEAETSLRAAFTPSLSRRDREDLVEEARDRLIPWLSWMSREGAMDEGRT